MPIEIQQLDIVGDAATGSSSTGDARAAVETGPQQQAGSAGDVETAVRALHRELTARAARLMAD